MTMKEALRARWSLTDNPSAVATAILECMDLFYLNPDPVAATVLSPVSGPAANPPAQPGYRMPAHAAGTARYTSD
jgi:hypothetical protein